LHQWPAMYSFDICFSRCYYDVQVLLRKYCAMRALVSWSMRAYWTWKEGIYMRFLLSLGLGLFENNVEQPN